MADDDITSPADQEKSTEDLGQPSSAVLPKKIGHYSIKSVIASGGMGTVYLAQQESPRRTVALKVMKKGIASRSALRRFEYESQILARLQHPNIAQVYESGTHDDGEGGVPYFAMEYIANAHTVVDYARIKKKGTRLRLQLFVNVCKAVHHGHQKGIIHRDLKPGNILVDSYGVPKIIDFGVARATDSDMTITTLQTDIGQLIGTLQYMSPEQCDADPHNLDTRSDVYSLGVVLYEMLTDHLPYDISRVALHEAARIIRETEPTPLSSFSRQLRGDVETIVLKALEKDRDRRYSSAEALLNDIIRYLYKEPLSARRASTLYVTRKFISRNGLLVASLALISIITVGATILNRDSGVLLLVLSLFFVGFAFVQVQVYKSRSREVKQRYLRLANNAKQMATRAENRSLMLEKRVSELKHKLSITAGHIDDSPGSTNTDNSVE